MASGNVIQDPKKIAQGLEGLVASVETKIEQAEGGLEALRSETRTKSAAEAADHEGAPRLVVGHSVPPPE